MKTDNQNVKNELRAAPSSKEPTLGTLAIWGLLLSVVAGLLAISVQNLVFPPQKVAYIDSAKLMVGFIEASKVERALAAEDEAWRGQLKTLQDSLQGSIDKMSKEYNTASPARKRELQDMLAANNQQINNFRQANSRKMDELRTKKMRSIFEKINLYVDEYGKKNHYSIIFGTAAGGSILYGNQSRCDITAQIIKGLNGRYE